MKKFFLIAAAAISLTSCGGGSSASFQPGSIAGNADVNLVLCDADGMPQSTPSTFSMSVSGAGNFRLSANGNISFAKSGTFQLELSKDGIFCNGINGLNPAYSGYIATASGQRLTGYGVDANGAINTSVLTDVNVFTGTIAPNATSSMSAQLNLDSRVAALPSASFGGTNPATYHYSVSTTFFDSVGALHLLKLDFVKTAANTWDVFTVSDENAGNSAYSVKIAQIGFNANGALSSATPAMPVSVEIPIFTNATSPVRFGLNLNGTTQQAAAFSTVAVTQDGYAFGIVNGFSIAADGKILTRFSNDLTRVAGQVAIVP